MACNDIFVRGAASVCLVALVDRLPGFTEFFVVGRCRSFLPTPITKRRFFIVFFYRVSLDGTVIFFVKVSKSYRFCLPGFSKVFFSVFAVGESGDRRRESVGTDRERKRANLFFLKIFSFWNVPELKKKNPTAKQKSNSAKRLSGARATFSPRAVFFITFLKKNVVNENKTFRLL